MIFFTLLCSAFPTDQIQLGTLELENIKVNARRFLKEILSSSKFTDPIFKDKISDFNATYEENESVFEDNVIDFIKREKITSFDDEFSYFLYVTAKEAYKFIHKISSYKLTRNPDKIYSQIFGEEFKNTFTICKNIRLNNMPKIHVHDKILDKFFNNLDIKLQDQNCISTLSEEIKCDLESIAENITYENGIKIVTRSCDRSNDIPLNSNINLDEINNNYVTTELMELNKTEETNHWNIFENYKFYIIGGIALLILLIVGLICCIKFFNRKKSNKKYNPLVGNGNRRTDMREIP